MNNPPFKLYPEEQHWWSFNDYAAVLDVMDDLKPKTVLEFGPGSSTLALIEGGAQHIDSCEDQGDWFDVYSTRLEQKYPQHVKLHLYQWSNPISVNKDVDRKFYDMALIDGPHGPAARIPVIEYCITHARAVLVPLEEISYGRGPLRDPITLLAHQYALDVEEMRTGPLSGSFILLTS
jgi:hypothetical protein